MLVDRIRKIVRRRRWIQRPSIILALLLIVLAFLARVVGVECGRRAVEHDEVAFFDLSVAAEVYRMRIPPYSRHSTVVLSAVLANEKLLLQTTNQCEFSYYIVV